MKKTRVWWIPMVVVVLGTFPSADLVAQEEHPGFQAASGRVTFRAYCSNCHGAEAKGNGNIAKFLKIPPSDLTLLQHNNDGEFPQERVYRVIDGRDEIRTHGARDMPIWGDVFQSALAASPAKAGEAPEDRVHRKIMELIRFLETLQAEPEE